MTWSSILFRGHDKVHMTQSDIQKYLFSHISWKVCLKQVKTYPQYIVYCMTYLHSGKPPFIYNHDQHLNMYVKFWYHNFHFFYVFIFTFYIINQVSIFNFQIA